MVDSVTRRHATALKACERRTVCATLRAQATRASAIHVTALMARAGAVCAPLSIRGGAGMSLRAAGTTAMFRRYGVIVLMSPPSTRYATYESDGMPRRCASNITRILAMPVIQYAMRACLLQAGGMKCRQEARDVRYWRC